MAPTWDPVHPKLASMREGGYSANCQCGQFFGITLYSYILQQYIQLFPYAAYAAKHYCNTYTVLRGVIM